MSTNTTPTPQELAEAVARAEYYDKHFTWEKCEGLVFTELPQKYLRTLLAAARAPKNMGWPCDPSQGLMECDKLRAAPRLTEAQRKAVRFLSCPIWQDEIPTVQRLALRELLTAFPKIEQGGGE